MTTYSSDTIRRPSVTAARVANMFDGVVAKDFFGLTCGEFLGGGVGRGVFECLLNEDLVIKVEVPAHSFQNISEWQVWQEVKNNKKLSPFFAPCISISACGTVLAMARTLVPQPHEWKNRMPAFLSDFNRRNFGMYEDRLVVHDYGYHKMLINGTSATRMVNAGWRN